VANAKNMESITLVTVFFVHVCFSFFKRGIPSGTTPAAISTAIGINDLKPSIIISAGVVVNYEL
jgi:hypothetical protein